MTAAKWIVRGFLSLNDGEAANMGHDEVMEHDRRYDRADEFVEALAANGLLEYRRVEGSYLDGADGAAGRDEDEEEDHGSPVRKDFDPDEDF